MADRSPIEWTDATWNPITGCTLVSDACRYCYAARLAATRLKHHPSRRGLARLNAEGVAKFTGEVRFNEEWLDQPLRWCKPRRIFVCAHGDLFHEAVPEEWIDQIFAVMALCPGHIFQVLTKRPERMRDYLAAARTKGEDWISLVKVPHPTGLTAVYKLMWPRPCWPLANVWLGVSIEDQNTADTRIPALLDTPAAVRFLSAEPLLGPMDLSEYGFAVHHHPDNDPTNPHVQAIVRAARKMMQGATIDCVICGGESGPDARPMHPGWARSLRDQCQAAGVPFFFKQWGEWGPDDGPPGTGHDRIMDGEVECAWHDGADWQIAPNGYAVDLKASAGCGEWIYRLGKKTTGRLLDGREWSEMPG